MMTPLSLETMAHDLIAERVADAERRALIAQLPRQPKPAVSAFATTRVRAAHSLRQLARRLDPNYVMPERTSSAETRLAIARSR